MVADSPKEVGSPQALQDSFRARMTSPAHANRT